MTKCCDKEIPQYLQYYYDRRFGGKCPECDHKKEKEMSV